jgi:hypothetical protein
MLRDAYTLAVPHGRSLPSFREPVFKATYSCIKHKSGDEVEQTACLHVATLARAAHGKGGRAAFPTRLVPAGNTGNLTNQRLVLLTSGTYRLLTRFQIHTSPTCRST